MISNKDKSSTALYDSVTTKINEAIEAVLNTDTINCDDLSKLIEYLKNKSYDIEEDYKDNCEED